MPVSFTGSERAMKIQRKKKSTKTRIKSNVTKLSEMKLSAMQLYVVSVCRVSAMGILLTQ